MSKIKVFNDPIYGLINFPFEIIYELIDHRFFQRLRRISQVGLSSLVYPGAVHTRFNHALGVAHLSCELITNLRIKGVDITDSEYEATCICALLHDIGHGPYSHALEYQILPYHHEEITLSMMLLINEELDHRLDLAIEIFTDKYHKKYLHQLLSSQLDVDRMDYLNRDSYYTGVVEGMIGYDRIIKMMDVVDEELVIEEKGLYSIEMFLISRYMMYNQVYLHKAAVSAEQMLKAFFQVYKETEKADKLIILNNSELVSNSQALDQDGIEEFAKLDDYDLINLLKSQTDSKNFLLNFLSNGILQRNLFKTLIKKDSFPRDFIEDIRLKTVNMLNINQEMSEKIVILGETQSAMYTLKNEINIKTKSSGQIVPFSTISQIKNLEYKENINFLTFPKKISEIH
jgi:uncharacterized protein